MRALLDVKASGYRDRIALARCFDLRAVEDLTVNTARELRDALELHPKGDFRLDIGERAICPADKFWLEWNDCSALVCRHDVSGIYTVSSFAPPPDMGAITVGAFRIDDGEVEIALWKGAESEPEREAFAHIILRVLAALAVINSPAARQENVDAHRGFARILRGAGVSTPPGIVHTRVLVGRQCTQGAGSLIGSANPKAYHFCRAHTRQRASGKTEQVRAHWRGDPAFGYRLPSYTVKTPALIEGDRP